MCNKICAYFPLSSSSSERGAAGRGAGRAGDPAGARGGSWPPGPGSPGSGGLSPHSSPGRRSVPSADVLCPGCTAGSSSRCRKSPGSGCAPRGRSSLVVSRLLNVSNVKWEPVPAVPGT